MKVLPAAMRIEGKLAVVVGAGALAASAVRALLAAGAHVRVVAKRFPRGFLSSPAVERVRDDYRRRHLTGAALVVAAASNAINSRVKSDARAQRVILAVPDSPESGDIVLPPPEKAAPPSRLSELPVDLDDVYAKLAAVLSKVRPRALKLVPDARRRRAFFEALADDAFLDGIRRDGVGPALARAEKLLDTVIAMQDASL